MFMFFLQEQTSQIETLISLEKKILHKDLVACYISTYDQCANIFTKRLTIAIFISSKQTHSQSPSHESTRGC
jgi:hypothetical protein